jgi:hypothetical protein
MMATSGIDDIYRTALAQHAKVALVEVVNREPDMTLEDLAGLIAANPGLGGLTLDELLTGLRARRQAELSPAPTQRSGLPPVIISDRAAERITGYETEIRDLVEHGLQVASELGLVVHAVRVRARCPAPDEEPLEGIFIDFRVHGPPTARSRFWDRIHEPAFDLPFEVSLIAS